MNIGDRVRVVHGSEAGVITRIIDDRLVEIEIEDGFTIPVLKSELALVAKEEGQHFTPTSAPAQDKNRKGRPKADLEEERKAKKGIYIAFEPLGTENVLLHFINNTSYNLAYHIYTQEGGYCQSIDSGGLPSHTTVRLTDWSISRFESWPLLHIEALYSLKGRFEYHPPLRLSLKVRAASYHKNKKQAPLLGKECHLFQVDQQVPNIQAEDLRASLLKGKTEVRFEEQGFQRPPKAVDLHIEKIIPHENNIKSLSNEQILSLQMKHFHKALDSAIISGMDEITFIHGTGNGTLRNKIQKELSQSNNIKYYKDAMKEKFGHGATLVRIK